MPINYTFFIYFDLPFTRYKVPVKRIKVEDDESDDQLCRRTLLHDSICAVGMKPRVNSSCKYVFTETEVDGHGAGKIDVSRYRVKPDKNTQKGKLWYEDDAESEE